MSGASIWDVRVGLGAALLFVTWAAIAFLASIVIHLHLRLARLERVRSSPAPRPYGSFIGARLSELLGDPGPPGSKVVVVVSNSCTSCEEVLSEISSPDWTLPAILLWKDGVPQRLSALNAAALVPLDGPSLAARLGVGVTPFALFANEQGIVTRAGPVNSLKIFLQMEDAGVAAV